jgi:hypothetical protein
MERVTHVVDQHLPIQSILTHIFAIATALFKWSPHKFMFTVA